VYRKQNKRSQPGFTLVEIVVALSVAALVLVGVAALMYYMVVGVGKQSDQVTARLQVQYVSFWIGEDVVQAQEIVVENSAGNAALGMKGFPLTITWQGDNGNNNDVVYYFQDTGQSPWQLTREHKVNGAIVGNLTVSEYLVPWSLVGKKDEGTWGNITNVGNATNPKYMLNLTVSAQVDQAEASGTYEISPRARGGNITVQTSG
jgi:prepilin-type N-terminal cleavage/methylation domain-containing protein